MQRGRVPAGLVLAALVSAAVWGAVLGPSSKLYPRTPALVARHLPQWTGWVASTPSPVQCAETHLVLPTGMPPRLSCADAKRIIAQARESLAAPPRVIDPAELASGTIDWLDPHGLWSAAPDTPAGAALAQVGLRLRLELEMSSERGGCPAAREVGQVLVAWIDHLHTLYERGVAEGRAATGADPLGTLTSTPFEDGPLTRGAPELAGRLGRDVGIALGAFADLEPFALAAEQRFLPRLDEAAWSEVVLAAAVRAYVPILDAHGAWAPLDEETSIYDLRLEAQPPSRLWDQMTRTALGVRIDSGAQPPLEDGDVVLQIHEIATAGLSVEQSEQLSILPSPPNRITVTRLRSGERAPSTIEVVVASATDDSVEHAEDDHPLAVSRVAYGIGTSAVIAIPDIPDDLGVSMQRTLATLAPDPPVGVMLDVRGNGGGSTDGALDALGVFLADRAMFPMKRRDGGIEIDRTPAVRHDEQWHGPVAVLTDGNSASAAEMIAGAVAAYDRGVVVGGRTYGKGCAQEYMDDDANTGVLRLTTLLFALPDGTPVQKVGVVPDIQLGLAPASETEGQVAGALDPWRGPDVRQPGELGGEAWPAHGGRVGPCEDETVCRALRALGTAAAAAR